MYEHPLGNESREMQTIESRSNGSEHLRVDPSVGH